MYCPKCFNNSMKISSKGVLNVIINGKQMDAGRFLFDSSSPQSETDHEFTMKAEEFFKWYSGFKNPEPIQYVQLLTADVQCESKCQLSNQDRVSVLDLIISRKKVLEVLTSLGEKYNLVIKLQD